ncbi:uncharacterized protein METZ01_LOCUS284896 [marine metagenome]|uniref:Uncharacterized protein n=1 Tax=marine metagenome TaxID=408172 RepID=A0A382LA64_9ZZZZ
MLVSNISLIPKKLAPPKAGIDK